MPKLYIENGVDRGKSYIIRKDGPFFAGRDKAAQVVLADEMASRRHFQIEHREDKFFVRDLESSNGTFLNGSLLRKVEPLAPNDRIQVGTTLISFQDDKPHPLIGREISGYRILDRIGRGGMGTVYRALQTSLDRVVALKVLAPHLVKNTNFVNLFIREARAAGALSHPNVVQVYDVGVHEDIYFFSMEYIHEGSVEDLLNRHGPIPLARALRIVNDAAQGLQYAEQVGIIHRDIKPGNLMIGAGGVVKIGDLGISRSTEGEGQQASQKDGVSGSPHYIAPEQAKGYDIDSRVDIYSLGCSFYQMLSGSTPFRGSTPREVILKHLKEEAPPIGDRVEGLPNDVARAVHFMMAKSASDRVRNAGALLELLAPLLRKYPDEGSDAVASGGGMGLGRLIAVAAVVVGLVGVGVGGVYVKHRADTERDVEQTRRESARAAIEELRGLAARREVDAFDERHAKIDRADFTDAEWAEVEEARELTDTVRAEIQHAARVKRAEEELRSWVTESEGRLTLAKGSPWEARVTLFEALAAELEEFVVRYESLDGETVVSEARSRSEGLRDEATKLRDHEEKAMAAFERLQPAAKGKADAGDYLGSREVLDQFDLNRFAGTAGAAAHRDALLELATKEGGAWDILSNNVADLIQRKEFANAEISLNSFRNVVAFESTRSKVNKLLTEVKALKEAAASGGADGAEAELATIATRKAWEGWLTDLDVSDLELDALRDKRIGVSDAVKAKILEQAELLGSWRGVLAGLHDRRLERIDLKLPSETREVRALEIDGDKIRFTDPSGRSEYLRWHELAPEGRVDLLTALARSSEERLFAGLLGKLSGSETPASRAAWDAATGDPKLAEAAASARAAVQAFRE